MQWHIKSDKNSNEERKLDRAVAELTCMDQVPVYTVEKHGFRQISNLSNSTPVTSYQEEIISYIQSSPKCTLKPETSFQSISKTKHFMPVQWICGQAELQTHSLPAAHNQVLGDALLVFEL